MSVEKTENGMIKEPQLYAISLIVGKNFWLTKIRWFYTILIFLFFILYTSVSDKIYLNLSTFILIASISIIGNIIFILYIKHTLHKSEKIKTYDSFFAIAILQLDFDLVVLSLLVFFSGGFDSPVIVLFIFYIMVSTFLIYHKKALRNTLIIIFLVVAFYFSQGEAIISSQELTNLIGFNLVLLFSFFISLYLSKNLRENERVLHSLLKKTSYLSVTDGLTGLYNQTHFFKALETEVKKSHRHNRTFSLIIFDLDHFKNYKDNNGHIRGSEILSQIGSMMKEVFRDGDVQAKYGGDEFVVILTNTDSVGAFLAAERLREIVEKEPFHGREKQPQGKITLSLGIANYPEHATNKEEILEKADKALYLAKDGGRNRTIIYNPDLIKAD